MIRPRKHPQRQSLVCWNMSQKQSSSIACGHYSRWPRLWVNSSTANWFSRTPYIWHLAMVLPWTSQIPVHNLAGYEDSAWSSLYILKVGSKMFPVWPAIQIYQISMQSSTQSIWSPKLSRFQYASPHQAVTSLYPPIYSQTIRIYRVANQKVWP